MGVTLPLTKVIARGTACTVECIVRASGESPAEQFLLGELAQTHEKKKDPQSSATARFLVLFQMMANYGRVSPKRFKKEMASDPLSVFSRWRQMDFDTRVHQTGCAEEVGRLAREEVTRAEELMAEYWRRKKQAVPNKDQQS